MPGFADLFGHNGVLEQLFLFNLLGDVMSAEIDPAITALKQDADARHPINVLDPATLAGAAVRGMTTIAEAQADAGKSGINADRFKLLVELATVRLSPADLAEAVLRSYLPRGVAESEAARQGLTAAQFATLTDLAGDGIAPTDAVRALVRGLIPETGKGPNATSYEQAIAESRLHDKWGPVLHALARQLLTPADLASAVVRNFLPMGQAEQIAARQGVDSADLRTLVNLSADAPSPLQLAEALRRGDIPATGTGADSVSFEQGIAEGRLANKWSPVIKALAQYWPSPIDALDAQVKGQITDNEAHQLYRKLGGDPQFESWLYGSIGEGPTPLEAATLAGRGIIPWHGTGPGTVSYEQAVRESHYRNKWSDAYKKLAEHITPPSTVVTQLAHQVITRQQATVELLRSNMTADQAAAYVAEAEYEAVSDYRGLTQSAVADMYFARLLSHDQAVEILGTLHVSPQAAELLLAYVDVRYVIESVNRTVARLQTLYTARKVGTATVRAALLDLKIPAEEVEQIITDWQLQAAANVKTLTEAQIIDAWYYTVLTQDEAIGLLRAIGYTPLDAWVLLSNKAKGPLPGKPAQQAVSPGTEVIPGTT